MTVVKVSTEIDAPADDVWAVVSDPRNLPRWSRFVSSVDEVPEDGLTEGSRYVTVMRLMAARARVLAKVLEWKPPTFALIELSGPLDATVMIRIRALAEDRSLLEHEVDYHFHGGPIGELVARSLRALGGAQFALRQGIHAQKRQVEEG